MYVSLLGNVSNCASVFIMHLEAGTVSGVLCGAEGGHFGDNFQGLHSTCLECDSATGIAYLQRPQQSCTLRVAVQRRLAAHHRKRRQHSARLGYFYRTCDDCAGSQSQCDFC